MIDIGLLSSLTGAVLFLILTGLLLINWRGQLIGILFITCAVISVLFFAGIAYNSTSGSISLAFIRILELLRDVSWLVLLSRIVKFQPGAQTSYNRRLFLPIIITGLTLAMLISIVLIYDLSSLPKPDFIGIDKLYYGYLFLSLIGLVLIEQIYRNTKPSYRWAIKYLCVGLGGIFLYDFFIYSDAVLFKHINSDLWHARGAVNALCVPLIVVSIRRIREWKMELFISRHIIFQSSIILLTGLYLSFMAISGYYVRIYGGSWGGSIQTVFLFAALMGLVILIFSKDFRARLRIFLVKHFYENKYDYRDEWLGFTHMLTESKASKDIYTNIVKAFAQTMKCSGGGIWLAEGDLLSYFCVGEIRLNQVQQRKVAADSNLVKFLNESRWVISLENYKNEPQLYNNLQLPKWVMGISNVCLIMPLFNEELLIGFIILTQPEINANYNWEDFDLLKTMGQQAASYIAFLNAMENLAEAKQFEAFNRLSAFVVHDMKNLIAQLSLITTNAKKFRDNQEFLADAFDTIDNAIMKMNRLVGGLKKGIMHDSQTAELINMVYLLEDVIKSRETDLPIPQLIEDEKQLMVMAEKDRLAAVVGHLIQNAQEATPDDGKIELLLKRNNDQVEIQIVDTGCGMDEEFIRKRLFKPFDTTKGNAGMGIGAYESREIVRGLGGNLEVESKLNEGAVFKIKLPLFSKSDPVKQEQGLETLE